MLDKKTSIGLLAPITWSIPPKAYGPWERDVADLAKELVKAGYENIYLYATKEAYIPGVKTVAVIDAPLGEREIDGKRALEMIHIAHALEHASTNVDIINNHLNYLPLLFSAFIKAPIITTLHGAASEPEAKRAFSHYNRLPYISLTNAERAHLPELNYVGNAPNGIDFDEFSPAESVENYLVNTGRIHPSKGIHHAIEFAHKVGRPLFLAGPIDDPRYFAEQVKPRLDKQVRYLGNLGAAEVHQLVSRAHAFVALIDWDEPFGRSIAEAMASGTPVIGTARGSHNELVVDKVTGIRVKDTDEAVRRFKEVATLNRQECRKKAYELFSLEAMRNGYIAAFEKVLAGGRNS
jgi:glycosyltransferase involved in cell wall biosynthesis